MSHPERAAWTKKSTRARGRPTPADWSPAHKAVRQQKFSTTVSQHHRAVATRRSARHCQQDGVGARLGRGSPGRTGGSGRAKPCDLGTRWGHPVGLHAHRPRRAVDSGIGRGFVVGMSAGRGPRRGQPPARHGPVYQSGYLKPIDVKAAETVEDPGRSQVGVPPRSIPRLHQNTGTCTGCQNPPGIPSLQDGGNVRHRLTLLHVGVEGINAIVAKREEGQSPLSYRIISYWLSSAFVPLPAWPLCACLK